MNIVVLEQFLQRRLKKNLPGIIAQDFMRSYLPDGSRVRIKHSVKPRESGVLILLYVDDGEIRFPLIQRQIYKGIHSGQMGLPGGKKEESDENLIDTALREAQEEIGTNPYKIRVLGTLSSLFVDVSNYHVLPVLGVTDYVPVFTADSHEVAEIITPRLADLLNKNNAKSAKICIQNGIELDGRYFDLDGRMVWGATAMILSELVHILNVHEIEKIRV